MVEPLEHQSIYKGGHEEWRLGSTCDECEMRHEENLARFEFADSPYFNIKRLRNDNASHQTQYGMQKEIFDAAREGGYDITRAR